MISPLLREASLWSGWLSVLSLTTSPRERLGDCGGISSLNGQLSCPSSKAQATALWTQGSEGSDPTPTEALWQLMAPEARGVSLQWLIACNSMAACVHEGLVWMWAHSEHIVFGAGEPAWPLRELSVLRLDPQFLAPKMGGPQPPVIPTPGDLAPSASLGGRLHTCTYI